MAVNRDVDHEIARLAHRQHHLFAWAQATALGASKSLRGRRLASGAWTQQAHGVYGLVGALHTWRRQLMLAHLDLGPRSVVSHRSAAALHAFPGFRPGTPELVVPKGAGRSHRWRVHESGATETNPPLIDHIPVTSPMTTVLHLAAVIDRRALAHLVENLLCERRFELEAMTALAGDARRHRRRGAAMLAGILDDLGPGYEPPASVLEGLLFAALRKAGLPEPVHQHPLPSITGRGRVDAAYPDARLILEADGRRWHTRVADFARDRQRDIDAGMLGWRVLRFVWADLVERPAWVCDVVAHHLAQAA